MALVDPAEAYGRRLETRRAQRDQLARRHQLLANLRLAVFLVGVALLWPAFGLGWFSPWFLLIPLAVFFYLVSFHDRSLKGLQRAGRAVTFYERGLDRLGQRWMGKGEQGICYADPEHPYAADLDIFGKGSLFELLCSARTGAGESTLADWLNAPAAVPVVRARQEAVAELRPRLDLREDLAVLGVDVRTSVDARELIAWGAAQSLLTSPWLRFGTEFTVLLTTAALVAWIVLDVGSIPFVAALIIQMTYARFLAGRVEKVIDAVDEAARELSVLGEVLARLEREPFTSERLRELQVSLESEGQTPSRRIAQLATLLEILDARRNLFFAPIGAFLMWTTRLALAIDRWRSQSGPAIARWLATVGELEALSALGSYAFDNPNDPFPELIDHGPVFEGTGLAHPLLPNCVRNDLCLGSAQRVLIVSGSNMSGKSTFLRTVGINVVLALAGAPVRATKLRLSPFALGATLRIQDSLMAGKSRFYAEITRIRQLVDLTKQPLPLLFLLDEILHGTNSHDRRIGAQSIVRGLVEAGAVGLVTTHDLALADIAESLGSRAGNVHFEDQFEGGQMVFDYRLRPGIVRNSNALALMRAVGLDV